MSSLKVTNMRWSPSCLIISHLKSPHETQLKNRWSWVEMLDVYPGSNKLWPVFKSFSTSYKDNMNPFDIINQNWWPLIVEMTLKYFNQRNKGKTIATTNISQALAHSGPLWECCLDAPYWWQADDKLYHNADTIPHCWQHKQNCLQSISHHCQSVGD